MLSGCMTAAVLTNDQVLESLVSIVCWAGVKDGEKLLPKRLWANVRVYIGLTVASNCAFRATYHGLALLQTCSLPNFACSSKLYVVR